MANTKTAKQNVRLNKRQAMRNQILRSKIRTSLKNTRLLIQDQDKDVVASLKNTLRDLDKSVTKGIMHINKAARLKQRLMALYNTESKKPAPSKKESAPKKVKAKTTTKATKVESKETKATKTTATKAKKTTDAKVKEVKATSAKKAAATKETKTEKKATPKKAVKSKDS